MPIKVQGQQPVSSGKQKAAVDTLLSSGFDSIAKGGTVASAIASVLTHLVNDPKTRKAVEPQLKKLFGSAEAALKGSKTAEAGIKSLQDAAASKELKSRIGKELQGALGDKLGGSLGGHIGAVLSAFAKGGLGAAVASTAAHAKDVKALIDGAGGTAKVVEQLSEKIPVVGLADSVAKHGKTAATGTSSERWVGFATIAANIIATIAPSWGATALKAADALKARAAAKSEFGQQQPAPTTGTDTPVAGETAPPQASDGDLFGGAVTPKNDDAKPDGAAPDATKPAAAKPISAFDPKPMPKGSERAVRDVVAQLKAKFEPADKFSPAEAESAANRIVLHAVEVVYGKAGADLTVKEVRERVMEQIEYSVMPEALAWAGKPTKFKAAQVEPGASAVATDALVKWYAEQGVDPGIVLQQLERLNVVVNGAVPTLLLNAYEGSLLATFDTWSRGEPIPTVSAQDPQVAFTGAMPLSQPASSLAPSALDVQAQARKERLAKDRLKADGTVDRPDGSSTVAADLQRQAQALDQKADLDRKLQADLDRQGLDRKLDQDRRR